MRSVVLSVHDSVEVLSVTVAEISGLFEREVFRVRVFEAPKKGDEVRVSGRRDTYLIWRWAVGWCATVLRTDVTILSSMLLLALIWESQLQNSAGRRV